MWLIQKVLVDFRQTYIWSFESWMFESTELFWFDSVLVVSSWVKDCVISFSETKLLFPYLPVRSWGRAFGDSRAEKLFFKFNSELIFVFNGKKKSTLICSWPTISELIRPTFEYVLIMWGYFVPKRSEVKFWLGFQTCVSRGSVLQWSVWIAGSHFCCEWVWPLVFVIIHTSVYLLIGSFGSLLELSVKSNIHMNVSRTLLCNKMINPPVSVFWYCDSFV